MRKFSLCSALLLAFSYLPAQHAARIRPENSVKHSGRGKDRAAQSAKIDETMRADDDCGDGKPCGTGSLSQVQQGGAPWGDVLVSKVLKKLKRVFDMPVYFSKRFLETYECVKVSGTKNSTCAKLSANALAPRAQTILRLGFHDCAKYSDNSGGCDACINLKGVFTQYADKQTLRKDPIPDSEALDGDNNNMALAADTLEAIYTETDFPPGIPEANLDVSLQAGGQSRADLWALATLAAAAYGMENNEEMCQKTDRNFYKAMGLSDMCRLKPSRPMRFSSGRADCPQSIKPSLDDESKFYRRRAYETVLSEHGGNSNADGRTLQKYFEDVFNFTARETVAIMGAHSFGTFHADASLFKYTWKRATENFLNNEYYRILALKPHYNKQTSPGGWHVVGGPGRTDENWAGEIPKTRWMVRALNKQTSGGPYQWSHQYERGPDCKLQDGTWVAQGQGNEGSKSFRSEHCCKENTKAPDDATIDPKCFTWISQDEEAIAADTGLYLDFTFDSKTGRPLGCNFPEETKRWKNTAVTPAECPKQQLESKDDRQPKKMYEIVEQYADDQNVWIDDFVATLEKMLTNGGSNLHFEGDIPTPGVSQ